MRTSNPKNAGVTKLDVETIKKELNKISQKEYSGTKGKEGTVYAVSLAKLEEMKNLLLQLKVPAWLLQVAKPCERLPREEILTEEQYYKLAETIAKYRQSYNDKIKINYLKY